MAKDGGGKGKRTHSAKYATRWSRVCKSKERRIRRNAGGRESVVKRQMEQANFRWSVNDGSRRGHNKKVKHEAAGRGLINERRRRERALAGAAAWDARESGLGGIARAS